MENTHDNLEKLTNKWVEEAGLEQPSSKFVKNVMGVIDAKTSRNMVYRPLISRKVWLFVAVLLAGSIIILYFLPQGQNSIFEGLDISSLSTLNRPFSGIELSKTMVYAIGFMALFLIQIPFLKRKYIN